MLIERWHKKLKHEYMRVKGSIRVDALVELLVNTPQLMEEDRKIKMARGLTSGRSRLREHLRAHRVAEKLYGTKAEAVKVLGEGRWSVADANRVYNIKQSICICDEKNNNHCTMCNACPYAFCCDCERDATSGVSCAHIHAVLLHGTGGLLRDDLEADENLPLGKELEVETISMIPFSEASSDRDAYYVATEDDRETNVDVDKQMFDETETVGTDESREDARDFASRVKSLYLEAAEKLEKHGVQRHERFARRSELSAVGRLPHHKLIRLQKRSAMKSKERSQKPQEDPF